MSLQTRKHACNRNDNTVSEFCCSVQHFNALFNQCSVQFDAASLTFIIRAYNTEQIALAWKWAQDFIHARACVRACVRAWRPLLNSFIVMCRVVVFFPFLLLLSLRFALFVHSSFFFLCLLLFVCWFVSLILSFFSCFVCNCFWWCVYVYAFWYIRCLFSTGFDCDTSEILNCANTLSLNSQTMNDACG